MMRAVRAVSHTKKIPQKKILKITSFLQPALVAALPCFFVILLIFFCPAPQETGRKDHQPQSLQKVFLFFEFGQNQEGKI